MDWFSPTGKVSNKLVHLLRWTTFPGPTGQKFWLNGSRPYRCKIYHNYSKWRLNIYQIWADFLEDKFLVRHIQAMEEMGNLSLCVHVFWKIEENLDLLQSRPLVWATKSREVVLLRWMTIFKAYKSCFNNALKWRWKKKDQFKISFKKGFCF